MTGKARRMGAALPGYISKDNGANPNMIQFGDKLQGLPPLTGRRDPYRVYKTKAGGNAPDRFMIFCINQLGGIGMRNKNSQFAPNADGLGWCPNRKNRRYNRSHGKGDIGDDDDSLTDGCQPSNSALTQYVTGMYLNTIWSLITDSSAIIPSNQTIDNPPGVRCDGWLCGAPDVDCATDSCCNAQRMSWFQLNSDKAPRDFYMGFDQTNYISSTLTVSQQTAFHNTMTLLGYKDDTHIWWVFGGSDGGQPGPTSQASAPPPTSDGGDNDVVTIIQANSLALESMGLSAIYGVNFDIEPGTELTQNITTDSNYLISLIERLSNMNPFPVTHIQFTTLPDIDQYSDGTQLLQNIIATIASQKPKGVNFRLQFMPYAYDSIMSNCGYGSGCDTTPDKCACYMANLLMRGTGTCTSNCDGSPLTSPASESVIKTWPDLALYFQLPFFGAISLNLKTAHTGLQGGDTDQQQIIKEEEELLHKIYDILKSHYDRLIIGKSSNSADYYTYDTWNEQSGHINQPSINAL